MRNHNDDVVRGILISFGFPDDETAEVIAQTITETIGPKTGYISVRREDISILLDYYDGVVWSREKDGFTHARDPEGAAFETAQRLRRVVPRSERPKRERSEPRIETG